MSAAERNFNNYQLGDNVYELADRLLPQMARAFGYELSEQPDETNLRGFISHIGPAKWLQDNIGLVRERLGSDVDAVAIAANWADRSGALLPASRSFASPDIKIPESVEMAFITGGVARWMLRRANVLAAAVENGQKVGKVWLPIGEREMKESEHDLVAQMTRENGTAPTERDFARVQLLPILGAVGLSAEIVDVDSTSGSEIMARFVSETNVAAGTVLAVGNAPSAIQTTGQFRLAARKAIADFDANGVISYSC